MEEILSAVKAQPDVLDAALTGSRIICNPAPTNTDLDIVVLAKTFWPMFTVGMRQDGSKNELNEDFCSYKKGELNYIVTTSPESFERWCLATNVAKDLNLLKKDDRIELFNIVLNNYPGEHWKNKYIFPQLLQDILHIGVYDPILSINFL